MAELEGDKLGDYVAVLKAEAEANGELPKVEIKCDLTYTLKLPASKVDRTIVTCLLYTSDAADE